MTDSKRPEEGQIDANSTETLTEDELKRRKLLKRAIIGTGAVASAPLWVRPVVNTVVLPAHADASGFTTTTTTTSLPTEE